MSLPYCLRFFCVLMALGLLVRLAGHAKAQATFSFTTLDVPGVSLATVATGIKGARIGGVVVISRQEKLGSDQVRLAHSLTTTRQERHTLVEFYQHDATWQQNLAWPVMSCSSASASPE
jgi:hypothetical protein